VDVVLPKGSAPPLAGVFVLKGDQTRSSSRQASSPRGRNPVTGPTPLKPDSNERVEMGDVTLQVIERGGRYAIRLRDRNAAARREFTGCRCTRSRRAYRSRRMGAVPEPRRLKVPNVLGETESMVSPGYAEFELGGKRVQVVGALEEPGSSELWFILRDQTSGKETYPAGASCTPTCRGPARSCSTSTSLQPAVRFTPHSPRARCRLLRTGCRSGRAGS
jgi:hypothetical protein